MAIGLFVAGSMGCFKYDNITTGIYRNGATNKLTLPSITVNMTIHALG